MSLQSRIAALITAIGADIKDHNTRLAALEAGGGGGGTNPFVVSKAMSTNASAASSTTSSFVGDLWNLDIGVGIYQGRAHILWSSSVAGTGCGFWTNPLTAGNTINHNGVAYSATTGTTATTGVVDDQGSAAVYGMMEARPYRGAPAIDPGTFNGVAAVGVNNLTIIEFTIHSVGTQKLDVMMKSDATGATINIDRGSNIVIQKVA